MADALLLMLLAAPGFIISTIFLKGFSLLDRACFGAGITLGANAVILLLLDRAAAFGIIKDGINVPNISIAYMLLLGMIFIVFLARVIERR